MSFVAAGLHCFQARLASRRQQQQQVLHVVSKTHTTLLIVLGVNGRHVGGIFLELPLRSGNAGAVKLDTSSGCDSVATSWGPLYMCP